MELDFGVNQGLVEEQYCLYQENPLSVDDSWRRFFEKLEAEHRLDVLQSVAAPAPPGPTGGGCAADGSDANGAGSEGGQARPALGNGDVHISNGAGNGHQALLPGAALPSLLPGTAEYVPDTGASPDTAIQGQTDAASASELQGRVSALVNAYRVRGHLYAHLDPLDRPHPEPDELSLTAFGLDHVPPQTLFHTGDMEAPEKLPLSDIVDRLQRTYCRTIGAEFTFMGDSEPREWLQKHMEGCCNSTDLTREEQLQLLNKLTDAELFEQFLHTKYVGAKRFSLEGAESVIPLLELLIIGSAHHKVEEIVIGMAHRGRLNVLGNVMEKSLSELFFAFEDDKPEMNIGRGDVKYHMGYSSDRVIHGHSVHLTLCFNPSHLEWVNPVVEGRVRAKQDRRDDVGRKRVLPLVIHGDAAFAGQGVVAETLNMGGLQGYSTGGTVHVVINNQIGFTTAPEDSRSTPYCTDITRLLRCPVFHVNGEDPDAVAQSVRMALEFRQKFSQDVVIDMYCYRRYGHNEGDEPRYTQPMMYHAIDKQPSVREMYIRRLMELGEVSEAQADEIVVKRRKEMEDALTAARRQSFVPPEYTMAGVWRGFEGGPDIEVPDAATALPRETLQKYAEQITWVPEDFKVNKKAQRFLKDRRERGLGNKNLDWGTAEMLAYASLLTEGTRIRLSGQDARRGTFSHRHAVLFDADTGKRHIALMHLGEGQGHLDVWDSPLSEAGVLGFEYGYSLDTPDSLVIWEAQFGDFANTAQVIIDQFISSSEDKWHRLSGLVMLLPHGFEGQGPEHSSARLERFLALCAEDNMQVCNLTTPAQIFHCLRRQVVRSYRKPLVIMSPKSLLRNPAASSTLDELTTGTFQHVIKDDEIEPSTARRVVLCTGKVYYDLLAGRRERQIDDVALVRIEQLYPLREADLSATLAPYPEGTDVVWVQEEPFNSGSWYYIQARLPAVLGHSFPLRVVARPESASPATGSNASHKLEQQRLVEEALS